MVINRPFKASLCDPGASAAGFLAVVGVTFAWMLYPCGRIAAEIETSRTWPVINVKKYGAVGNGSHDDTAAFAAALQQAASNKTGTVIQIPAGTYLLNQPRATPNWWFQSKISLLATPDCPLLIQGAGSRQSKLVAVQEATILDGFTTRRNQANSDLTVTGITFECRTGFSSASNTYAIVLGGSALRTKDVVFRNWTQAIRVPEQQNPNPALLSCEDTAFLVDHGRAGIGQRDRSFAYPTQQIVGAANFTRLERCSFDGLVDPMFAGVGKDLATGKPIDPSQYTPVDGLIFTDGQARSVVIKDCKIKNGYVEHITLTGDELPSPVTVYVRHNVIVGPDPFHYAVGTNSRPSGHIQSAYTGNGAYGGMCGMRLINCVGSILDNSIADTQAGVRIENMQTTGPQIDVIRNQIDGCAAAGIRAASVRGLFIAKNVIQFRRNFSAMETLALAPTQAGLQVVDCHDTRIFDNVIKLSDSGWWTGECTLTQDCPPNQPDLYVDQAPPPKMQIYLGLTGINGAPNLSAIKSVVSSTHIQVGNYPSVAIRKGAKLPYMPTSAPAYQRNAITAYRSGGGLSCRNILQGGFMAIWHKGKSSWISRRDIFLGYGTAFPISTDSVSVE